MYRVYDRGPKCMPRSVLVSSGGAVWTIRRVPASEPCTYDRRGICINCGRELRMDRLFAKGSEFYSNAMHMNTRGCHEVIREVRPIVYDLRKKGLTFDDVLAANPTIDLETDPYMKLVKGLFEEELPE